MEKVEGSANTYQVNSDYYSVQYTFDKDGEMTSIQSVDLIPPVVRRVHLEAIKNFKSENI